MGIMDVGDDSMDNNYPVKVKNHQPANRSSSRRELSTFPVDTFDLRVHVLIGYMEEAIRRPTSNYVMYDQTDESDDDIIGSDNSSGEETSDDEEENDDDKEENDNNRMYKYTKYNTLASFFTEKDGTQEPYDVCVRFSYNRLVPDVANERISQATQTENDPVDPANRLWELVPKKENVKKSKLEFPELLQNFTQ